MRRLIPIALLPMLVACSSPAASPVAPAAGPAAVVTAPKTETQAAPAQAAPAQSAPQAAAQTAAQPAARTEQKPTSNGKPEPQAAAWPKAAVGSPAENHGIAIGQPLKVGPNSIVVMVTNTTDQVMTFNIATTVRKGGSEVQVSGTVSDLLPKQSRPAMATSTGLIPSDPESISVAVTSVRTTAASTPKGDIAKNITVSEPKSVANSSNVTVEVTNNDSKQQSIALYSAYLQGDQMVAYGEGQAAGLKPGETRTVTLRPVTPVKPNERVAVTARVI